MGAESRQETPRVERRIVDLNTLDQLVRDELNKVEGARPFGVALWRHEPDVTGANWDGCIKSIGNNDASDPKWNDVLPKLRANFSLDG